jgi:hypothetical protein
MTAKKKASLLPTGRPGALTEQVVFRVSKATAKRLDHFQREKGLETRADALRAALRQVGL